MDNSHGEPTIGGTGGFGRGREIPQRGVFRDICGYARKYAPTHALGGTLCPSCGGARGGYSWSIRRIPLYEAAHSPTRFRLGAHSLEADDDEHDARRQEDGGKCEKNPT